ncbi:MAG: hypothetical protein P8N56_05370 [Schleiferiaceae bacterium]|nr:hypothetical protein [Schleiferiaceae bacterium]
MRKMFSAMLLASLIMSCTVPAPIIQTFERVEPEFTTVDRLMELKKGMTKEEVFEAIGVYPYEVLYNEQNHCEIHIVKYAKTKRTYESRTPARGTSEQLDFGDPFYDDMSNMAIYYRNGGLEAVVSESVEQEGYGLLSYNEFLGEQCNPNLPIMPPPPPVVVDPIEGCMDVSSLTYNPDATVDDGSCEFCECGYIQASYTTSAEKAMCPPCLPSQELWDYWILDGRCDIIKHWVETYPPLIRKVPAGFIENCKPKPEAIPEEECTWCKLLEESNVSIDLTEIELNLNATQK